MAYSKGTKRTAKKKPAKKKTGSKKTSLSSGSQIRASVLPKGKKVKANNDLMKQLAVVLNPFSGATEHPKIPDGAVTHSLARRLRNNFSLDSEPSATGWTDIVIAPSFGVACTVQNYTPGQTTYDTMPTLYGFPGQTVGYNLFLNDDGTKTVRSNNAEIVKQRVISQGARLSCFNSDNQNDGWFEACRLNIRDSSSNYAFQPLSSSSSLLSTANDSYAVGLGLDNSFHNGHLQNVALVEQPGYQSGLLKDLHKFDFSLCPSSNEIEFKQQGTLTVNADEIVIPALSEHGLLATSPNNVMTNRCVDRDFDAILVRIHGRHNTASPSRVLVEAIQNVEFVFANTSDFSSFMTSNDRHAGITMALDGGMVPAGQRNSRK